MAVCPTVGHVASDLGRMAGGSAARIQTVGTPVLKFRVGDPQRARRLNNCGIRKMESLSVKAVADVATGYDALATKEEMLRRADSYFATDSRPIVLFDGMQSPPPWFHHMSITHNFLPPNTNPNLMVLSLRNRLDLIWRA